MYGNKTLPGFAAGSTYRNENSIWQGYPEATWFKNVKVIGNEETKIAVGTILKENISDGTYSVFTVSDIVSAISDLPGARLVIVADFTALSGVSETVDDETTFTPSSVLVGISGQVDKAKILVGETVFTELTAEQQVALNAQLEAWHFQLVDVMQA